MRALPPIGRVVVAVRAALPSPRPQGWQALQMAAGFADLGLPTTLVGDASRPDGGPRSIPAWLGRPVPAGLALEVPPRASRPPWAGVQFRRSLRRARGVDALLVCRDPRVAAVQPREAWGALVMEWHVAPDPTDARHREALRRPHLHVVQSLGLRGDLLGAGVPAGSIALLPNACGLDRERALARSPSGSGPVVALGLHRRGGLDDALAAWEDPSLPPLHIAGRDQGGERTQRWQQLIADRGLGHRVRLLGPVWGDAREDLLDGASAWLAAYPDTAETRTRLCPLQVADALGSGVPLVSTSLPSIDALAAGSPWHAYRAGDPRGLARAVLAAIESRPADPATRPQWVDRARALVEAVPVRAVA